MISWGLDVRGSAASMFSGVWGMADGSILFISLDKTRLHFQSRSSSLESKASFSGFQYARTLPTVSFITI